MLPEMLNFWQANLVYASAAITTCLIVGGAIAASSRKTPLPPGPKGWPVIGNLFDMPKGKQWIGFAELAKRWGDIYSLNVLGQTIIIVNSVDIAHELMDKRGTNYSNRIVQVMGGRLVGFDKTLVLLQYGDRLQQERKLFHQLLGNPTSLGQFFPCLENEAKKLVRRIIKKPDGIYEHLRTASGAVALKIAYGYELREDLNVDPFVAMAEQMTQHFSHTHRPGAYLVDYIPALKYIPAWFPGAKFKRQAKLWAEDITRTIDEPHKFVKQKMATGTAEASFTSNSLEAHPELEQEIKDVASAVYTVATFEALIVALTLHSEIQRKAQVEIDNVTGGERLPTVLDHNQMPYVDALCKEILRWHVILPMGFPHVAKEDDIYNGYFIPKGAMILPNAWQMGHDPNVYSDPFTFNPDRFLGQQPEPDPRSYCFGFGRRISFFTGKKLADYNLFITVATLLACLDIFPLTEQVRRESKHEQKIGALRSYACSYPVRIPCAVKHRNTEMIRLVEDS
ncbi:hypothetical protein AMATHDRAFT_76851 [Amanita thiersii Skay4041]|uniref:Cytochrome P450 n=1 Tax=Amanita thiersii Skay4041 TaxID=703135 RepID=A0A2A9NKD2_9AGAR|nr:hypothetical protein AMATHDRAFT_76851 [Amanita thiersii Skay4041]